MNSLLLVVALVAQDPDAKKSAQQLLTEAQRLESVGRNFVGAAEKYQKAVDKAVAESSKTLAAHALLGLARCAELKDPEDLEAAQKAYKEIVDTYGDVEPVAAQARKKQESRGVDVLLQQFRRSIHQWRERKAGSAADVRAARETVWGKMAHLKLEADQLDGLFEGLADSDELVRDFAAESLSRLIDEAGIAKLIPLLNDPRPAVRGGASLALERVFLIWREAEGMVEQAKAVQESFTHRKAGETPILDLEEEIKLSEEEIKLARNAVEEAKKILEEVELRKKGEPETDPERRLAALRVRQAEDHVKLLENTKAAFDRSKQIRQRAAELRNRIPDRQDTDSIQKALAGLIRDEQADPTARLEASKAALSVGDVAGELADALVEGMASRDRNVRVGCARAAAGVSTRKGEDKHKLVDRLIELVRYEPEKEWTLPELTPKELKGVQGLVSKLSSEKDEEAVAAEQELLRLGDKVEPAVRIAADRAKGEKARRRFESLTAALQARRWANDALVRQAAAQALGNVGLVKGIPPLIDALDDNHASVRKEANQALMVITGQNVDYDSDPPVPDPMTSEMKLTEEETQALQERIQGLRTDKDADAEPAAQALLQMGHKVEPYLRAALVDEKSDKVRRRVEAVLARLERLPWIRMTEEAKRTAQLKIRGEGIQRWKEWWEQNRGVPVLIDRFWAFQARWTTYNAADLFDQELFLRMSLRTSAPETVERDRERAEILFRKFTAEKDIHVLDAVDLGPEILDKLIERLDGAGALERVFHGLGPQQKQLMIAKSQASTRLFVAAAVAQLAAKSGTGPVVAKLSGMLESDKAAGAAAALGLLGKAAVDGDALKALETYGLGSTNPAVLEAAANTLARVGGDSSTSGLTEVAVSASAEPESDAPRTRAAIAALRALTVLKPKNEKTVQALSDLVGDEPQGVGASKKALGDLIREFACEALGAIAEPAALPSLARARRDTKAHVREAAKKAIQAICGNDTSRSRILVEILKNEQSASQDRVGSALALGDTDQEVRVHDLVGRLIDRNPPRDVHDGDPAVRAAVCRALAAMKNKTQLTVEALLQSMADPADEVRQEAYDALAATVGSEVAQKIRLEVRDSKEPVEFDGSFEFDVRKRFLDLWNQWYEGEKGNLPKTPREEA